VKSDHKIRYYFYNKYEWKTAPTGAFNSNRHLLTPTKLLPLVGAFAPYWVWSS